MIFEELVTTTIAMQDLQKKTAIKNNKAMQDNTDTKYRLLLKQADNFVNVIDYLYSDLCMNRNQDILSSLANLVEALEAIVESGLASRDGVTNADSTFKSIQNNMKKEWGKLYFDLTGGTVSTLEAIRGIDPDNVGTCLQKIQPAENWDLDIKKFRTMKSGLDDADQLIMSLGVDDEIINFLQNANAGKATLFDLNDNVLAWIREERLESKIRISFVKSK